MKQGITLAAAVCFGAAFGACVRNVVADARAQPVGPHLEYSVVGGSMTKGGAEEDLNRMAREGWRFAGTIQRDLVFERTR